MSMNPAEGEHQAPNPLWEAIELKFKESESRMLQDPNATDIKHGTIGETLELIHASGDKLKLMRPDLDYEEAQVAKGKHILQLGVNWKG